MLKVLNPDIPLIDSAIKPGVRVYSEWTRQRQIDGFAFV